MHEYSLIQALLNRVKAEARARQASAVSRLSVSIGELAGVERNLFASAFELCRCGTVCADAELEVEAVEARWVCRLCGRELARGEVLSCPACGASARLAAGDEIVLKRIEMEVA